MSQFNRGSGSFQDNRGSQRDSSCNKKSWDNCDPITLSPLCSGLPRTKIYCVDYAWIVNREFEWSVSQDPCGNLRIPLAAAADLGFDERPPRKEETLVIANPLAMDAVIPPPPVNSVPSAVVSAYYSCIDDDPSEAYPYWVFKPWNFLDNAELQWKVGRFININFGTYKGGKRIKYIDAASKMIWLTPNYYGRLLWLCRPGCSRAVARKYLAEFGDIGFESSTSEEEVCNPKCDNGNGNNDWNDDAQEDRDDFRTRGFFPFLNMV